MVSGFVLDSRQSLQEAAKNLINMAFSDGLHSVSEDSPRYDGILRVKPNISNFFLNFLFFWSKITF